MKRSGPHISIRTKMVLAFILVAVPPMLIASALATHMLTRSFGNHVESWLRESSYYLLRSIDETQSEAGNLGRLIIETVVTAPAASRLPIPNKAQLDAMREFGFDIVLIYDDKNDIVYSSNPIDGITPLPLRKDISLFRVVTPTKNAVAVAGVTRFQIEGKAYNLFIGCWLDGEYLEVLNVKASLEGRLYYLEENNYNLLYSSRDENAPLPLNVIEALRNGADSYYLPGDADDAGDADNVSALYTALRNEKGELRGVIFCGLHIQEEPDGPRSQAQLFWGFFLVGTLFSSVSGLLVARRLAKPVQQLIQGVRSIVAGNFTYRVEERGNDEVSELARGFNEMGEHLQTMRDMEKELHRREKASALGEVAIGFAHEIRNPLVVIKTSAELVHARSDPASRDTKLLGYVIDEVGRIEGLIKEFLLFAKPAPPDLRPLDLAEVVASVLAVCLAECEQRNVVCGLEKEDGVPAVLGDQNLLHQVFLNLILNALDAMPEGGSLRIRLYASGSSACLDFADTGTGIAEEIREKIFLPFFTTKDRGTGLGLAKISSIMQMHGGSIACKSALNQGSAFTLCFPPMSKNSSADTAAGPL